MRRLARLEKVQVAGGQRHAAQVASLHVRAVGQKPPQGGEWRGRGHARTQRLHGNKAGRRSREPFDFDRGGLGRRRVDPLFDSFPRDAARTDHPQPHHLVRDPGQLHVGQRIDCAAHPRLEFLRMQPVKQEQAGHQIVARQRPHERVAVLRRFADQFQHPIQAGAVKVEDGFHKFTHPGPGPRIGSRFHLPDQSFDSLDALHYPCTPNMGEWRVSITLPLPRYMCTPHGRHGSKLRTARMMSMPRKFSGPFSSKMGVFCTASS